MAESGELRPRLRAGLAVVVDGEGLLVEGGASRRSFTGGSATELLPKLLSSLDGRSGVGELAELLDVPDGLVRQGVSVLDQSGLVEYVDATTGSGNAELYLSRSFVAAPGNQSSVDVLDLLVEYRVLVVARSPFGEAVEHDLRDAGIGGVRVAIDCGDEETAWLRGGDRRLVLLHDDVRGFAGVDGVPVLRFGAFDDGSTHYVEVGPLFHRGTACFACFARGRAELAWPGTPSVDDFAVSMASGLVVAETMALIAGLGEPMSYRVLTRTAFPSFLTERFVVTPYPDCGCVRLADSGPAGVYDWQIQVPPADFYPRLPAWEILPRHQPGPAYPTCPVLKPKPELSGLLRSIAGPGYADLAGNEINATETYLITGSALDDMPGNVYKYDADEDALIVLRNGDVPIDEYVDAPKPWAAIVLVSTLGRVMSRSHRSRYRVAGLNAGAALQRLAIAATGHGVVVEAAEQWDDQLAEVLELYPGIEVISAVACLYRKENGDAADR